MDVGSEDLGQTELVDDRIEAFRFGIATMWGAFNDEKVDVIGAPETVEKLNLLAHPLRLGGVGGADDDEVVRCLEPFLQFLGETARLDVGRGEEHRADGLSGPTVFAAQRGRQLIVLQFFCSRLPQTVSLAL